MKPGTQKVEEQELGGASGAEQKPASAGDEQGPAHRSRRPGSRSERSGVPGPAEPRRGRGGGRGTGHCLGGAGRGGAAPRGRPAGWGGAARGACGAAPATRPAARDGALICGGRPSGHDLRRVQPVAHAALALLRRCSLRGQQPEWPGSPVAWRRPVRPARTAATALRPVRRRPRCPGPAAAARLPVRARPRGGQQLGGGARGSGGHPRRRRQGAGEEEPEGGQRERAAGDEGTVGRVQSTGHRDDRHQGGQVRRPLPAPLPTCVWRF